ncbi:MAG: GNAT family N-acetyltransferase [Candidatus Eisenbacteria bacterium]|uniref:GNAT family N-acetyltransferase n=1 Tax=Eiseniibacteriota bacterium TaxID=2212470 RepID=A0A956LY59_UNCEI|nr:GNAT family N-acetyltransferase [Candidatus Eisenbacteria bacterium]
MPRIELRPADPSHWADATNLHVRPDQESFVPPVEESRLIDLSDTELAHEPLFIWSGGILVGFCSIYWPTRHSRRVFLGGFLIDAKHQGRGLGKAAFDALLMRVRDRHPDCRLVTLTVHPDNVTAQTLYRNAGFVPTGREIAGHLVFDRALHPPDRRPYPAP